MTRLKKWVLSLIFGSGPWIRGDSICRNCCHYKLRRFLHKKDSHWCLANARKDICDPVTGKFGWIGAVDCYDKNAFGTCKEFFEKEGLEANLNEVPKRTNSGINVDSPTVDSTDSVRDEEKRGETDASQHHIQDGCTGSDANRG